MVRPIRTISPQKEVRRSIRERTTVYRSLAENQLGNAIDDVIQRSGDYRLKNHHHPSAYTRSGRKIENYYEASEDDFPEQYIRRTRRTSHHEHDDENSPLARRIKRRKVIVEDESEQGSLPNEDSHDADYSNNGIVKQRDEIKRSKPKGHIRFSETQSPPSQRETRLRKRGTRREVHDDAEDRYNEGQKEDDNETKSEDNEISANQTNGAVEEPENVQEEVVDKNEEDTDQIEDDEPEPRSYQLRQRRERPIQGINMRMSTRNQSRPSYREGEYRSRSRETKRSELKRRMCRSDSSSTGSEDEREMRRKVRNDDARFEKRKDRSMIKARNRFVPINLTGKDLTSSQAVIRERMRQTGASCSDVDPMTIDKTVGFDEIGGLGPHIQSLKEVVLFPLLYPDIFQSFNINPPKGVLFYGPPGTGKTLVARALANECSRGNKKVAFFMRKGADCLSKWVGESERQLRILFDQAYSMRPSIIFFDEIDGLAPVRSTRQDQIHSSIVSTLLALMDGLDNRGEVIVIGATNRLDSIDPALRRPGRFDRELRFSLPDSAARLQILKIHTSQWNDSKPDETLMNWISQHTSGYCGADLKYLCTEAVMISLRSHYPHIYMSHERLKLNLSEVKVTKGDLLAAMKRITPASRRDLSIPCRPLDERTSILLATGLQNLLDNIPEAYKCSRSVEVTGSCELEKIVRALEEQPPISAVRMLLNGHPKCPNSGQTSYVLPALLSKLDHLPVHCISISKLFADGRPEEAFATIFQAALRSAATGPCILLCPSLDEWFKIVPLSITHMLKVSLDQITGFTPILFLATVECSYADCSEEIIRIFRIQTSLQIPRIPVGIRREYFKHICGKALEPPKIFDPTKYIQPEVAKTEDLPVRRLSEKEAKELEKLYENQLREFRIFLRDQLGKLSRDRRFLAFMEPVDAEEAEDYYEIIKEPMCFTQMQEKVDRREYTHPDQFLADIKLIVNNALEYNPTGDHHSKLIRHSAIALKDIVEEYFEKEFDEDFVDDLESTARLLLEAKIVPQNEQLLNLPDGFVRKVRWSVVNGFKGLANSSKTPTPNAVPNNRLRMFRGSTYKLKCNKKKQKSRAIAQSIAQSLNQTPDNPETSEEKQNQAQEEFPDCISANSAENMDTSETRDSNMEQLMIDENALQNVINVIVQKTDEWPIPELEALAAAIANIIEQYRSKWDRCALPDSVVALIESWDYDPRPLEPASP